MHDWYQIPALILTTLLLPAFGHLYLRSRDTRTLLWFLAVLLVVVRMCLFFPFGAWDTFHTTHPWVAASGEACGLLSSALLLASLSPLRFRAGKVKILYVIPFIAPMLIYAILSYGVFRSVTPPGLAFLIFPTLCLLSIFAGVFWVLAEGGGRLVVAAFSLFFFGGLALWSCFRPGLFWPLTFAESGNHVVAALLVMLIFRRLSPGVLIAMLGLFGWACPALLITPQIAGHPELIFTLIRVVTLAKVVTALGLILVTLENEVALNQATAERDRRARKELEAYTKLVLTRRRAEDFDRQGDEICQMVVEHSRFSQAALILMQPPGVYRLAGAAGLDAAVQKGLDALAARIRMDAFPPPGSAPSAVGNSQTLRLSLEPWLTPGDDLRRLRFISTLAVPMQGREATEGALLLGAMRPGDPLRPDDLLPLETLAARLQAVRSQTSMLEKLIDSEKFAGLGQLAGAVTQQLNNPLTVILGYASLLEEAPNLDDHERKAMKAILSEARTMRSTLQSLSRIARAPVGPRAAVSVLELVTDLERLHRSEFLQRSIEFRLNVPSAIPRVLCHGQQLRQAVLHCLQFAMEAVENQEPPSNRTVRLEAIAEGDRVRIVVAHSGPGFHHPESAFDPCLPPQTGGTEASGLGLSLCATILRENNGNASAVNLKPQGAAILLELHAA